MLQMHGALQTHQPTPPLDTFVGNCHVKQIISVLGLLLIIFFLYFNCR